jgi:hypothetical protein
VSGYDDVVSSLSSAADERRAVLTAVRRRLADEPDRVLPTLRLLADPDALVEAGDDSSVALAKTLNAHRIVARLREIRARSYTTEDVRGLLGGVSRQAVSQRVAKGRLMAIQISGKAYFPGWQFVDGGVVGDLPEILAAHCESGRDTLAADAVMGNPIAEEGGRTPADLVAAGDTGRALHYLRIAGGGF